MRSTKVSLLIASNNCWMNYVIDVALSVKRVRNSAIYYILVSSCRSWQYTTTHTNTHTNTPNSVYDWQTGRLTWLMLTPCHNTITFQWWCSDEMGALCVCQLCLIWMIAQSHRSLKMVLHALILTVYPIISLN